MTNRNFITLGFTAVIGALLTCNVSMADYGTKRHRGQWDQNHPRQAEVNGRLQNQENRLKDGREDGDLSQKEARQVMRQDRDMYRQEQRMKRRNGGNYLTPAEQAKLNREENHVSKEITRDENN